MKTSHEPRVPLHAHADFRTTRHGVRTAGGRLTPASTSRLSALRLACVRDPATALLTPAERHWLRRDKPQGPFVATIALNVALHPTTTTAVHTVLSRTLPGFVMREMLRPALAARAAAAPFVMQKPPLVSRVLERTRELRTTIVQNARDTAEPQHAPIEQAFASAPPFAAPRSGVEMVLRRQPGAPPAAEASAPQSAAPGGRALNAVPAQATTRAASTPFATHDLTRLTDAVVQSLDRRLRSYRERMGVI